jgi:hypothetical protein
VLRAAQVNNVKVVRPRARLEVARVGHSEVEARARAHPCFTNAFSSLRARKHIFAPQTNPTV